LGAFKASHVIAASRGRRKQAQQWGIWAERVAAMKFHAHATKFGPIISLFISLQTTDID
jgi:hypothetical protein